MFVLMCIIAASQNQWQVGLPLHYLWGGQPWNSKASEETVNTWGGAPKVIRSLVHFSCSCHFWQEDKKIKPLNQHQVLHIRPVNCNIRQINFLLLLEAADWWQHTTPTCKEVSKDADLASVLLKLETSSQTTKLQTSSG